jgi:aconitate hydratase
VAGTLTAGVAAETRTPLPTRVQDVGYLRLGALQEAGWGDVARAPVTVKLLLESVLRLQLRGLASEEQVRALAGWKPGEHAEADLPFLPARIVMQDHSGVPVLLDIAAVRAAVVRAGGRPEDAVLAVPADLVIDHSVQVDVYGSRQAAMQNRRFEYERNHERYRFLRWAERTFAGLRVVPPGNGIVHQINLEHLARCVRVVAEPDWPLAVGDTVLGTDSHTPMVNGVGVLGWGVGGVDAAGVLLGQPVILRRPTVVGLYLTGRPPAGTTATDVVLGLTQRLRRESVVGCFVECFGDGARQLSVPDRATIANMCPEYGATAALFPVDDQTLDYLRLTRRPAAIVALAEDHARAQGTFGGAGDVAYDRVVSFDLDSVEPSVAGPRRPQDRLALPDVPASIPRRPGAGAAGELQDGDVAIAAITSCTNTSHPRSMLAAGLLARAAVERGVAPPAWVKTSLAPGSKVVLDYLERAGLLDALERLRFHVVGLGCTTCIGNSGPLSPPAARAAERGTQLAAVLSGNRNFEARIHPDVRAAYLASPPLVVAYAIAGTTRRDLTRDPLGRGPDGDVLLSDLWPSPEALHEAERAVEAEQFERRYADVFAGDERWNALDVPSVAVYRAEAGSTYVSEPALSDVPAAPPGLRDIRGARVLVRAGDTLTTDHISPAGAIPEDSPAGRYLAGHGVAPPDFNTYGCRRGNSELMARATFANVRLRNRLVEGREGGWTRHHPTGEVVTIHEAARRYAREGTPLIVLAGREYGFGSSRDWAAKGPRALGVRAVIARGFERIHRSNLVAAGCCPWSSPATRTPTASA